MSKAALRVTSGRAADARTLYLAASQPLRVTSTGDALVISRADGEVWRLPVSRLLRIVCCGLQIDWSGAALALCMTRQISVSWLDDSGHALGHLWPRQPQSVELDGVLESLAADDPRWSDRYNCWLRGRRLAVLKAWGEQRALAGQPVQVSEWEQAKRRFVYLGEVAEVLLPCLGGMAAALITSRLADAGLQPRYWLVDGTAMELAADLHTLLWGEMNLCCGGLAQALERPTEATALFEHHAANLAGALAGHLASLRTQALRELHS